MPHHSSYKEQVLIECPKSITKNAGTTVNAGEPNKTRSNFNRCEARANVSHAIGLEVRFFKPIKKRDSATTQFRHAKLL